MFTLSSRQSPPTSVFDDPSVRRTRSIEIFVFPSAIVLLICCYAARSDKVSVHAQRAIVYVDGKTVDLDTVVCI